MAQCNEEHGMVGCNENGESIQYFLTLSQMDYDLVKEALCFHCGNLHSKDHEANKALIRRRGAICRSFRSVEDIFMYHCNENGEVIDYTLTMSQEDLNLLRDAMIFYLHDLYLHDFTDDFTDYLPVSKRFSFLDERICPVVETTESQCNEEHGMVGETFVSKPVQDCMRVVTDWMYEQMYAKRTVWNSGDRFDRMRDASDFLQQFLLGEWEG